MCSLSKLIIKVRWLQLAKVEIKCLWYVHCTNIQWTHPERFLEKTSGRTRTPTGARAQKSMDPRKLWAKRKWICDSWTKESKTFKKTL
jgi:hypothetical protein